MEVSDMQSNQQETTLQYKQCIVGLSIGTKWYELFIAWVGYLLVIWLGLRSYYMLGLNIITTLNTNESFYGITFCQSCFTWKKPKERQTPSAFCYTINAG